MSGIPILQVRGSGFVQYTESMYTGSYINSRLARNRMNKARRSAYTKGLSPGARKRLTRAITIMAAACIPRWVKNYKDEWQYFRMSFITVNLVQKVPVSEAKELFSKFMRWLREEKGSRADIWKMEFFQSGTPHFHILCSDYINYQELQDKWDRIQKEAGLLDEYAQANLKFKTNSITIEQVSKVKDLASYMIKELTKDLDAKRLSIRKEIQTNNPDISNEELEAETDKKVEALIKVDGKVWDCSMNLRGVPYYSIAMSNEIEDKILRLVELKRCFIKRDDFFAIINLTDTSPPDLLSEKQREEFNIHVGQIFNEPCEAAEILAEAVSLSADPVKVYTWQQMQLMLN